MSNKIFHIVENFYRSAYGQHRFLLNHAGIEMTLYKARNDYGTNYPSSNRELEDFLSVYGPGFNAETLYSPSGSVKLLTKIYSMSNITEETSELSDVTAYDYSGRIDEGDQLHATIGQKTIKFKVVSKKTIGFSRHIIYELILRPIVVQNVDVKSKFSQ